MTCIWIVQRLWESQCGLPNFQTALWPYNRRLYGPPAPDGDDTLICPVTVLGFRVTSFTVRCDLLYVVLGWAPVPLSLALCGTGSCYTGSFAAGSMLCLASVAVSIPIHDTWSPASARGHTSLMLIAATSAVIRHFAGTFRGSWTSGTSKWSYVAPESAPTTAIYG
jgi:hypothetical protein